MKIEQEKNDFKRITITFEKEEEAEAILSVMGQIIGGGKIRKVTTKIFLDLDKLGIKNHKQKIKQEMILGNEE